MQSGRVFFPEIYWENDGWLPFFHHYSEKNPTEETHKQPAHKKIGVAVLLLATYNTPDGLWGRKILIWNNRRRAPTALLMQQRCIEMDLEKIIAIIGLFPSFSIANIIYRVFFKLAFGKGLLWLWFFSNPILYIAAPTVQWALFFDYSQLSMPLHSIGMY